MTYGVRHTKRLTMSTNPTWLEPEELCYRGGRRRAGVLFPDGQIRIVRCGLPNTAFSIPAYHGSWGRGYVSSRDGVLEFWPASRYHKVNGHYRPRWQFRVETVKYGFVYDHPVTEGYATWGHTATRACGYHPLYGDTHWYSEIALGAPL